MKKYVAVALILFWLAVILLMVFGLFLGTGNG